MPDLREWQTTELSNKSPRRMIAAAPRLGKTLVGVLWLKEVLQSGIALVVAPPVVCPSWHKELVEALGERLVTPLYLARGDKLASLLGAAKALKTDSPQVHVVSFDRIPKNVEAFLRLRWAAMIIDESHYVKAPGSDRGRALRRLAKQIPNIRLLTGTPAPNGPQDLWGQMTMIDPEMWGSSFTAFAKRNLIIDTMQYNRILGARDPEQLQEMFGRCASVYRREDVFGPDQWQEVVRTVELPPKARALYDKAVKTWAIEVPEDRLNLDLNHTFSRMMRLQQIASGFLPNQDGDEQCVHTAKIDQVRQDLEDIVLSGSKSVVFHRFSWEGQVYAEVAREFGVPVFIISGSVQASDRAKQISDFESLSGPGIFVVQTAAGGIGISLASATHALFVSQMYSFDAERQARDRIFAPGKTRCITYYRAERTVDQYIASLLAYKKTFHEALSTSSIHEIAYGVPQYNDRIR